METIIKRGGIIFGTLLGAWFLLQQINWRGIFSDYLPEQSTIDVIEEKLGELVFEEFTRENNMVENPFVVKTVDSLVRQITTSNGIDDTKLKVYITDNEEVNAFALPNRQMVIYTGLIRKTENAEALAGVIAHELAHIEQNHVMKSLSRDIGIGVLFALISGNSNITLLTDIVQTLSSSAFSREMEREADLTGVDYLQKANISPIPFAKFIGTTDDMDLSALKWISSHPMPKERRKYILQHIDNQKDTYKKVISENTWNELKNQL